MPHTADASNPWFVEPSETASSSEYETMNTESEVEGKLTGPQTFYRSRLRIVQKTIRIVSFKIKRQKLAENECNVNILSQERESLLKFFENQCNFVYCCDISRLVIALGATCYDPTEWRLFIDSSKKI